MIGIVKGIIFADIDYMSIFLCITLHAYAWKVVSDIAHVWIWQKIENNPSLHATISRCMSFHNDIFQVKTPSKLFVYGQTCSVHTVCHHAIGGTFCLSIFRNDPLDDFGHEF